MRIFTADRPVNNCVCLTIALCALAVAQPAAANIVVEPTFQEKMDQSELVFIGTVTAIDRGGRRGVGSTAALSVLTTLKGENRASVVVSTYNEIDELNPRCCEVGATYIMFLRRPTPTGPFVSVRGAFGMIRIAGPQRVYRVVPATED
jgi:hypothetical protein